MTTTRRSLDVRTLRALTRLFESEAAAWARQPIHTYVGKFGDGMAEAFRRAAERTRNLARDLAKQARAASSKPSRKRGAR